MGLMSVDHVSEAQLAADEAETRLKQAKQDLKDADEAQKQAERDQRTAEEEARAVSEPERQSKLEIVHIYDEDRGIYSYRLPFKELAANLPITCRFVPDYASLRKSGMYAGAAIAGLALFLSVAAGIEFDPTIGIYAGLLSVILVPVLAFIGWDMAPTFPFHDYQPFWVVRFQTQTKEANALSEWYTDMKVGGEDIGLRRYLVPFAHSYLNLRPAVVNSEGDDDEEYTPFVIRASTAYHDSAMREEKRMITSDNRDKWEKIKAFSLIGLIFAELLAVFFLFVVSLE